MDFFNWYSLLLCKENNNYYSNNNCNDDFANDFGCKAVPTTNLYIYNIKRNRKSCVF